MLLVTTAAARHAADAPWVFLIDRKFWAWDGWTAVGALGQWVGAVGTVSALIFLWIQILQVRNSVKQSALDRKADTESAAASRRRDFALEHTPFLSLEPIGAQPAEPVHHSRVGDQPPHVVHEKDVLNLGFRVHADGAGPAYRIELVVEARSDSRERIGYGRQTLRYLRAPEAKPMRVKYRDQRVPQLAPSSSVRIPVTVTLNYISMYGGRRPTVTYDAVLEPFKIRLRDRPRFTDSEGNEVWPDGEPYAELPPFEAEPEDSEAGPTS